MTTPVLDVANPSSANAVGVDLQATTLALTEHMGTGAITDLEALNRAVEDRKTLADAAKKIEAFFDPIKSMAFKLHRAICDRQNAILAPVLLLDKEKSRAISAYKAAQDELRRQRERELAEQQRRIDQARAAEEAAALETAGESAMAEAVIAEAIQAPLPVVVVHDEVKAVVNFRREWKWRFTTTEERALQLLPREYLAIDERKLTAYAKAMKTSAALPGISVYYVDVPLR
jgi:hypothetical protein